MELPPTDEETRRYLTKKVAAEWKRQGRDRDPVVYNWKRISAHPNDSHLVKVVYSVKDPTFGMERPFVQHTLNLESGGMFGGHYDLASSSFDE